jgi:uncharacterized protein
MAKSLTDQLLEAGAVDKDRAARIKKAKHKQDKQRARGSAEPDEIKITASRAQAKKTERDRALSRQRQAALEEKAVAAQVRQLIEKNSIDRRGAEIPYNFSDQGVVKKVHITGKQQAALAGGRIAIARMDESYVLIPAPVAAKIIERDPAAVLVMNTADGGDRRFDGDDPYADYEIPDDLIW